MEAVAAMDFSTLSRRELQALSKLNGVRANMSNVAMAEALQSLPSVAGIDEIGTTLCLPTPGKSAMKSVLRASAAVGEDQQQGSPLPRGRRVSVKSPEAIRLDVEGGDDEVKRDLIKEIVRTPGVALRSRARATPAPIPTPEAGTLRRSQRSAARKAAAPVEAEVWTTKKSTRKTSRSKVAIDLDQEEEVVAAPEEEKVQDVEPKEVASDEKCVDPKYEEVTKPLEEGNTEGVEPEQGEEVNSSVVPMGSTLPREGVMENAAKPQEEAAVEVEQELFSSEKSTPLSAMGDSPILGVLSKVAPEPAIKNVEDASTEDAEGLGNWSPVMEITDEINRASEEKEVAALEVPKEAVKEDDFISTGDAAEAPTKAIPAAVADYETREGDYINEVKKITAEKLPKADLAEDELDGGSSEEEYDLDEESSEEDYDLDEESSEEDELREDIQKDLTVDADSDETIEESDSTDVSYDSDEEKEEVIKLSPKILEAEAKEDDFSSDLSPEFDNVDVGTETDYSHVAMLPSSGVNTVVKTLHDSAITEELEVSSEGDNFSEHVETIVKSLDKVTITEDKKEECEKEEKQLIFGNEMSLRKLKTAYKKRLIAAKEGEKLIPATEGTRIALAELDDNAGVDC